MLIFPLVRSIRCKIRFNKTATGWPTVSILAVVELNAPNIIQCSYNHRDESWPVKFIYSEKATNFCEISTVDLSYVVTVKSTVDISQNFVAFSEYMNFNLLIGIILN